MTCDPALSALMHCDRACGVQCWRAGWLLPLRVQERIKQGRASHGEENRWHLLPDFLQCPRQGHCQAEREKGERGERGRVHLAKY